MMKVRTIYLEILRNGPPHNQLLSPLTPYLGLCGSHEAAEMRVPHEHEQFLHQLARLRYPEGVPDTAPEQKKRLRDLNYLADDVTAFLGSVPGLTTSLVGCPGDQRELTHLRLVVSHDELSLFPFELTRPPPGYQGARNQPLALQPGAPVCITRQARSAATRAFHWPDQPRILFIYCNRFGPPVREQAHVDRLMAAIRPWLDHVDTTEDDAPDPAALRRAVDQILTVLANPTMKDIRDACAKRAFTHIHILAHGARRKDVPGEPFGVMLPSSALPSQPEVVTGERFAALLGGIDPQPVAAGCASSAPQAPPHNQLPMTVTLASCDSGGSAGAVWERTGSSFAFDLHAAGVPLVIASQFPLSTAGAPLIPEVIYPALLWGEDPRLALHRLRSQLYALHPETHDWASLVVYDSLPGDLGNRLLEVRHNQASKAIEAGLARIDAVTPEGEGRPGFGSPAQASHVLKTLLKALRQVETAEQRLNPKELAPQSTKVYGQLASSAKRKARVYFQIHQLAAQILRVAQIPPPAFPGTPTAPQFPSAIEAPQKAAYWAAFRPHLERAGLLEGRAAADFREGGPPDAGSVFGQQIEQVQRLLMDRVLDLLRESLTWYEKLASLSLTAQGLGMRRRHSPHWALGQILALNAVLRRPFQAETWIAARLSARRDLAQEAEYQLPAYSTLAELFLILTAYPEGTFGEWLLASEQRPGQSPVGDPIASPEAEARACITAMRRLVGHDDLTLTLTIRQLRRYIDWWAHPAFTSALAGRLERDRGEPPLSWPEEEKGKPRLVVLALRLVAILEGRESGTR